MGQISKEERKRFTPKQLSSRPRRRRTHGEGASKTMGGQATTFECGQDRPYNSQHVPGRFRVSMPRGRTRYTKETPCS